MRMITGSEEELEALRAGQKCGRCRQIPRIAWGGHLIGESVHVLRCDCILEDPPRAPLLSQDVHHLKTAMFDQLKANRSLNMTGTEIVKRKKPLDLSVEGIMETLCPDATPQEAELFLRYCLDQDLNPFAHEAYLVKYGGRNQPASITLGLAAVLRRADEHPSYGGYESGIVVEHKDGTRENIRGSLRPRETSIVGGWATIYRNDRKVPCEVVVDFDEYVGLKDGRPNKMWAKKGGTMIEKCAISQGHKRYFPNLAEATYVEGLEVRVEGMDAPVLSEVDASEEAAELYEGRANGSAPEASEEEPPEPVTVKANPMPDSAEGRGKTEAPAELRNVGELMKWANDTTGAVPSDVLGALGVTKATDIKDPNDARRQLLLLWEEKA